MHARRCPRVVRDRMGHARVTPRAAARRRGHRGRLRGMCSRLALAVLAVAAAACASRPGASRPATDAPILARGDTAERLAAAVIPANEAFAAAVAPDLRTIWFTRASFDRTDMQLMVTRWTGSGWSPAERASFSTGRRQMDPHLAPDGRTLLFSAPASRDSAFGRPGGDWDTWMVDVRDPRASAVRRLASGNTDRHEMYPSVTRDGTLWVQSLPAPGQADTIGVRGIKRVTRDGREAMVPGLADATNPWISPDERLLLFSSDRGGVRGDLFVQVRAADGTWGEAVNLGPAVNTGDVEFCPSLTADGRYLLFSRLHYRGTERTGNDIHVIRTSAVPVLVAALAKARS